jgi:hypothetical protein
MKSSMEVYMNIFNRKKRAENIDGVINFIDKHRKSLSQKCREAYDNGDFQSGKWWDCQACAMITLLDKLKKEFKQ